MKLDRSTNLRGVGKYIAINTRKLGKLPVTSQELAEAILQNTDAVSFGNKKEFVVIMTDDKHADVAFMAYGESAMKDDPEYGNEFIKLAERSGRHHPNCKHPD